ncbi:MAG: YhgE/Pip domain-containing protein [Cellulomonas sp.]|jgi:putative membrane protein|nr:YhgE/Pip domain-containing protein [Cellulomonas sp.]
MTNPTFWSAVLRPERPRGGGHGTWFTVLGLILVPLTVGGLLTWALWRPTDRLDRMTAAVVNEDTGVQIDGRTVPLGRQLAAGLVTSSGATTADARAADISGHTSTTNLTWEITSAADADAGLASGRYAAAVVIPENFSAAATSWTDPGATSAQQAQIRLRTSERTRPLDGVIAASVTQTASRVLGVTLTQSYVDGTLTSLTTISTELGTAATGAEQIASGTGALAVGAAELAAGADQLTGGAGQLTVGAGSLVTGLGALSSRTGTLASGVTGLSGGTSSLAATLGQITAQTTAAAAAAQAGVPAASLLATSLDQLATGVNGTSPGDPTSLSAVASALAAGASGVSSGVHAGATNASGLASGLSGASSGLDSFLATAQTLAAQCQADPSAGGPCQQLTALITHQQTDPAGLSSTLAALSAGATALSDGLAALDLNASLVAGGAAALDTTVNTGSTLPDGTVVPPLTTSTTQLAAGGHALADGVQQSATGLSTLAGYLQQSATGATTLATGASSAASGAGQLASGADSAASGSRQLFNSISQLSTGTGDLAGGASRLADETSRLAPGTQDLATGLRTATGAVPSYTADQSGRLASVIADPVTTSGADTDLFGASVVPWFMVLALWLGGLAAYLVLSPMTPRALGSTLPSWQLALRSFSPAALVGMVQGVGLTAVLGPSLGLEPTEWIKVAVVAAGIGMAFAAVNQGLAAAFGGTGRFIAALVATVGLAAAVVSTVPQAVVTLYAGSPLGPALDALRDAVGGHGSLAGPVLLLAAWTLGGLALTTVALARHRVVSARTLARWVEAA